MPSRPLVRAFLALYLVLGVVVCVESLRTVAAAWQGQIPGHDRVHALLLGSLEAIAAVLFLLPRTMRWGAAGLSVIFALAFLLHLAEGHPNFGLLIYGAAVIFVRIHGVRGYHWSGATA